MVEVVDEVDVVDEDVVVVEVDEDVVEVVVGGLVEVVVDVVLVDVVLVEVVVVEVVVVGGLVEVVVDVVLVVVVARHAPVALTGVLLADSLPAWSMAERA